MGENLRLGILISGDEVVKTRRPHRGADAAYLLRDRLNACGGINQAPIALLLQEANGTTPSEVDAMKDLIEEQHVHGVVAQFASQNPTPAIALAEQAETPLLIAHLNDIDSAIKLTSKRHPWGYTTPTAHQRLQAFAQAMMNQGYASIVLIRSDSEAMEIWQDAFVPLYESMGGTVVNAESPMLWTAGEQEEFSDGEDILLAELDQNERATQLQAVLNQGVGNQAGEPNGEQTSGAIALALAPSDGYDFLTTLARLRPDTASVPLFWYGQETLAQILADRPFSNPRSPEVLAAIAGITGVAPTAIGDGFQSFVTDWETRLETSPTPYATTTWDAVALFALAAQASGQNSRSGIWSELQAIATAPGMVVTDVCQALEQLRNQEAINLEGASGSLELSRLGEVPGVFNIWRLNAEGDMVILERLNLH